MATPDYNQSISDSNAARAKYNQIIAARGTNKAPVPMLKGSGFGTNGVQSLFGGYTYDAKPVAPTPPQPNYQGAQKSASTRSPVSPVVTPKPAIQTPAQTSTPAQPAHPILAKLGGTPLPQISPATATAQPQSQITTPGQPQQPYTPNNSGAPVIGNNSNAQFDGSAPSSYQGLLGNLFKALQPSAEEDQTMRAITESNNATNKLLEQNGTNAIPLEFMQGRGAQIRDTGMQNVQNLEGQLTREQNQRETAMNGLGTLLGASRLSVTPGQGYLDPNTGELINGGNYGSLMQQQRDLQTFGENTGQSNSNANEATAYGKIIQGLGSPNDPNSVYGKYLSSISGNAGGGFSSVGNMIGGLAGTQGVAKINGSVAAIKNIINQFAGSGSGLDPSVATKLTQALQNSGSLESANPSTGKIAIDNFIASLKAMAEAAQTTSSGQRSSGAAPYYGTGAPSSGNPTARYFNQDTRIATK